MLSGLWAGTDCEQDARGQDHWSECLQQVLRADVTVREEGELSQAHRS